MPFKIHKSIDIDFAHHVSGHEGACINIHGHTWKFEVCVSSSALDARGFVVDFKELKRDVLEPLHLLLDHSLALYENTIEVIKPQLVTIGQVLMCTRKDPAQQTSPGYKFLPPDVNLAGARNLILGGIKIASFPFSPTSERLAKWAFMIADVAATGWRSDVVSPVQVKYVSVYETLHPVESVATYSRD